MKKIYLLFFMLICLFTIPTVKANTLDSIDTDVYIDENGHGHVTEVWKLTADEGTESYHSFGNLEDRQITNFTVSRDGQNYTSINNWNVDATKQEKANKNGINYTNDGLELCWGIEYGSHTYTINYTINNLVWQYDDNQILYFAFLPQNMNPAPQKLDITVRTDQTIKDIKYSSYGFKSENTITNGEVNFLSDGKLSSKEYAVILIGFPQNTFNGLQITKQGTYDDVANEALKGATLNNDSSLLEVLLPIIFVIGMFVLVFVINFMVLRSKDRYDESEFNIPKKVNNFRDIPFNKDIIEAYFIGHRKGIIKQEHIMGAILLKWLKQKQIEMVETEGGLIDFNKNDNYYIDLNNLTGSSTYDAENKLKSFLIEASDDNKQLTPKAFNSWCRRNYTRVNDWLKDLETESRDILVDKGYIIESTENYTKNKTRKVFKFTTKLQDEFIKLKGLKQFLEDMSAIDEKKAIEVHLWDEYLIFAESFGIADKVAKQFKDFHPVEYENNYNYYHSYLWISTFSYSATTAATSASSGGSFYGGGTSSGGFSSGGGGVR